MAKLEHGWYLTHGECNLPRGILLDFYLTQLFESLTKDALDLAHIFGLDSFDVHSLRIPEPSCIWAIENPSPNRAEETIYSSHVPTVGEQIVYRHHVTYNHTC